MLRPQKKPQAGMTLIEVLIALLILFISLMGSAGMQLNALKHTSRALASTQASFIDYSMLDRMRANGGAPGQDQISLLAADTATGAS